MATGNSQAAKASLHWQERGASSLRNPISTVRCFCPVPALEPVLMKDLNRRLRSRTSQPLLSGTVPNRKEQPECPRPPAVCAVQLTAPGLDRQPDESPG